MAFIMFLFKCLFFIFSIFIFMFIIPFCILIFIFMCFIHIFSHPLLLWYSIQLHYLHFLMSLHFIHLLHLHPCLHHLHLEDQSITQERSADTAQGQFICDLQSLFLRHHKFLFVRRAQIYRNGIPHWIFCV